MKFRMLAPVLFLATGACFATRNDVRILQDNILRSDSLTQRRLARVDSQQTAAFAALNRSLQTFLDSAMRGLQNQMNNTGGSITTGQRALEQNVERIMIMLSAYSAELKKLSDENALTREQMTALRMAVAAQDSTRPLPPDGPIEKLLAGKKLAEGGSHGTARDLFLEVIGQASDSAVLAEAHRELAHTFLAENRRTQADSVFQVLYERYPASLFAAEARYAHGLSLLNAKQCARARAIFNAVVEKHPASNYATMAKDRLAENCVPI